MDQDEPRGEIVAAGGAAGVKKLGFFGRIALFFRQVIGELFKFTGVVLVFVVIVMAFVYGLDAGFSWLTSQVFGVPQ
jgi:preprotein translocase subunit SecE